MMHMSKGRLRNIHHFHNTKNVRMCVSLYKNIQNETQINQLTIISKMGRDIDFSRIDIVCMYIYVYICKCKVCDHRFALMCEVVVSCGEQTLL